MASPVEKKKKLSSDNPRLSSSVAIGEHEQKSMGSFVTSTGKRRSVRVAKKMNRILRKIWICADIWMDIFPFFDRPQLGLKLALLSPRFDVLVDAHFNGKSELTICRQITICKDSVEEVPKLLVLTNNLNSVQFPLPDRPLPNKIRFEELWIAYIDHSVLAFLRSNQQIFDKGTNFELWIPFPAEDTGDQQIWDVFVPEIWPIFASNIRRLLFPTADYLDNLRRITSPTILCDLNQLHSIDCGDLFSGVISDDDGLPNATSSAGQALFEWLNTPTKDGQPKRLRCFGHYSPAEINWINKFKQAFLRATTCASHILSLSLPVAAQIVPFELVNERTHEKLTLEKERSGFGNDDDWLFKRCPIGQTVQWEDKNLYSLHTVKITAYGVNGIGQLSPPTADQSGGKGRRIVRK